MTHAVVCCVAVSTVQRPLSICHTTGVLRASPALTSTLYIPGWGGVRQDALPLGVSPAPPPSRGGVGALPSRRDGLHNFCYSMCATEIRALSYVVIISCRQSTRFFWGSCKNSGYRWPKLRRDEIWCFFFQQLHRSSSAMGRCTVLLKNLITARYTSNLW